MTEAAIILDLEPRTSKAFKPLWVKAARYKGAWGGRGSGKSNDRAQAVILAMLGEPGIRIACVREVQKSIIIIDREDAGA